MMTGHHQFTVYLVGNHKYAILEAYLAHAPQLFHGPHASGRIVGIA